MPRIAPLAREIWSSTSTGLPSVQSRALPATGDHRDELPARRCNGDDLVIADDGTQLAQPWQRCRRRDRTTLLSTTASRIELLEVGLTSAKLTGRCARQLGAPQVARNGA